MRMRPRSTLLRFLLAHCLLGVLIGTALVALLLATNALGLADLVFGSESPVLAMAMLLGANALTFGSLAMGTGVMSLPYDGPRPRRSRERTTWARRLMRFVHIPRRAEIRIDR
ncbi:MAG: hypothetical protein QNJ94_03530 [Alphaproteobacteria bacterium]|nr:hypothetical protein [Alphaproteobacteria bacterium]